MPKPVQQASEVGLGDEELGFSDDELSRGGDSMQTFKAIMSSLEQARLKEAVQKRLEHYSAIASEASKAPNDPKQVAAVICATLDQQSDELLVPFMPNDDSLSQTLTHYDNVFCAFIFDNYERKIGEPNVQQAT